MIKTTLSSFAKSIGFNSQNYIPKEGVSFSLFRIEVLSGLTVALALVPEAIAFAFVAGVAPLSVWVVKGKPYSKILLTKIITKIKKYFKD